MKKILSGKVRDVYEVNDHELVIVTTDRISAFDVILPSTIKDKGVALNLLSLYWFDSHKVDCSKPHYFFRALRYAELLFKKP